MHIASAMQRFSGAVIDGPEQFLAAFGASGFERQDLGAGDGQRACRFTPAGDIGSGHLDYVEFNRDFVTLFPRLKIDADLPVRFCDAGWVRMHFRLGGHNTTFFDRTRRDLGGPFCNVLRLPDGMISTEVHSDRQVGWVTVFCRPQFLSREFHLDRAGLPKRIEAALRDRSAELLLENRHLPPAAWRLLSNLEPLATDHALGLVRCEAMVTELICLLLDSVVGDKRDPGAAGVTPADAERMRAVRCIIEGRAAEPPTIAELARAVGTNRTTLARAFRACFGQSVFDAIQETRMTRATQLLQDTSLHVGEVAHALGYSSAASFSVAFRKYYGVPPGAGRRRGSRF